MINCPHCHAEDSIEVLVDAYTVYTFKGFDGDGQLAGDTFDGEKLRTDEFEDYKVACAQCGEEVNWTDFEPPQLTDEKGRCEECGEPALFCLPDAYWNRTERPEGLSIPADLTNTNLRCGLHAALAASEGERVVYLFMEDDTDNPTDEQRAIRDHYPIKED